MSKILKRTGPDYPITDTGQTVPADSQLVIDPAYYDLYARSNDVITAISNGDLVYNDGSNDLSLADATMHLQGSHPQEIGLRDKTPGGKPLVSMKKADGSGGSIASHDWTDKCTWYQKSTRVTGESLTLDTGKIYNMANQFIIDLTHGRVSDEDDFSASYLVEIYDNGVEVAESQYTIDYENGKVTFDAGYTVTGPITADYSYGGDSTYTISPSVGKRLSITKTELQFAKDLHMNGKYVDFEIWVYNPLDLPNKFMYKRKRYKNIKDIINGANQGQGIIPAIDMLTQDILVFPFDYVTTQDMLHSQGAELRMKIQDNQPFTGEWATITAYFDSEDE